MVRTKSLFALRNTEWGLVAGEEPYFRQESAMSGWDV